MWAWDYQSSKICVVLGPLVAFLAWEVGGETITRNPRVIFLWHQDYHSLKVASIYGVGNGVLHTNSMNKICGARFEIGVGVFFVVSHLWFPKPPIAANLIFISKKILCIYGLEDKILIF